MPCTYIFLCSIDFARLIAISLFLWLIKSELPSESHHLSWTPYTVHHDSQSTPYRLASSPSSSKSALPPAHITLEWHGSQNTPPLSWCAKAFISGIFSTTGQFVASSFNFPPLSSAFSSASPCTAIQVSSFLSIFHAIFPIGSLTSSFLVLLVSSFCTQQTFPFPSSFFPGAGGWTCLPILSSGFLCCSNRYFWHSRVVATGMKPFFCNIRLQAAPVDLLFCSLSPHFLSSATDTCPLSTTPLNHPYFWEPKHNHIIFTSERFFLWPASRLSCPFFWAF